LRRARGSVGADRKYDGGSRAAGVAFHDKAVSLTDLLSGACDERLRSVTTPMFKSVGGGLQDVVIAELILTKARQAGLAPPPLAFETKH